jgi:hypothetical protein
MIIYAICLFVGLSLANTVGSAGQRPGRETINPI